MEKNWTSKLTIIVNKIDYYSQYVIVASRGSYKFKRVTFISVLNEKLIPDCSLFQHFEIYISFESRNKQQF